MGIGCLIVLRVASQAESAPHLIRNLQLFYLLPPKEASEQAWRMRTRKVCVNFNCARRNTAGDYGDTHQHSPRYKNLKSTE